MLEHTNYKTIRKWKYSDVDLETRFSRRAYKSCYCAYAKSWRSQRIPAKQTGGRVMRDGYMVFKIDNTANKHTKACQCEDIGHDVLYVFGTSQEDAEKTYADREACAFCPECLTEFLTTGKFEIML